MNRFHVHLNVADLSASIRFYSQLFASAPSVVKPDYAKWMLEDPRVNFAISTTGRTPGIDHLGIQVDSGAELAELGRRLDAAGGTVTPEPGAVCCYAQSDKNWTEDPQGTRWETFHTFGDATSYYAKDAAACAADGSACATPAAASPVEKNAASACCGSQQAACC
jgi:catechol 2,3-dioxygenase-like lactoylglutathione lyase family enzyme